MQRVTILDSCTMIESWVVHDPCSKFWMVRFPHSILFVPADAEYSFDKSETIDEIETDLILYNQDWNHIVHEGTVDGTTIALYAWMAGKRYIPSVIDVEETRIQLINNRRDE